jgi:hypothetical protein
MQGLTEVEYRQFVGDHWIYPFCLSYYNSCVHHASSGRVHNPPTYDKLVKLQKQTLVAQWLHEGHDLIGKVTGLILSWIEYDEYNSEMNGMLRAWKDWTKYGNGARPKMTARSMVDLIFCAVDYIECVTFNFESEEEWAKWHNPEHLGRSKDLAAKDVEVDTTVGVGPGKMQGDEQEIKGLANQCMGVVAGFKAEVQLYELK